MAAIIGDKELIKALNLFSVNTEAAVFQGLRSVGLNVLTTATDSMRKPSEGKTYTKTHPQTKNTYKHTASKEGDAPNVDVGNLIDSIRMVARRKALAVHVGTDLDYGAYLELVGNRPWLMPALEQNESDFESYVRKAVEKQINKAGKK